MAAAVSLLSSVSGSSLAVEAVSVPEKQAAKEGAGPGGRARPGGRFFFFGFGYAGLWFWCAAAAGRPHAPIIYAAGWDKPGPVLSEFSSGKNRRDGSSIPP